jgi:hypothetical protein
MPEPRTRTPAREGVVGWDGLVATKLHLPHLQPGFVPRRRLLDRLEAAPAGQLLLVCAPAGFGKTALLGDWAGQRRRAVAWLSLDEADNDPARFWRHVVAVHASPRTGRRPCPPWASPTSAWPRWPGSAASSTRPCGTSTRASRRAGSSSSRNRWRRASPPWRGSGRPRATPPAPWRRWTRPRASRPARRWPACSTPSRRWGRGCCWPRATCPRRSAGSGSAAFAQTTSPATPGSRGTCCWRGCCWPRGDPSRRSGCWTGCTPWRSPRAAAAA